MNYVKPNANLERISPKCSRGSNWAYLNWNYVRTAKKCPHFFKISYPFIHGFLGPKIYIFQSFLSAVI